MDAMPTQLDDKDKPAFRLGWDSYAAGLHTGHPNAEADPAFAKWLLNGGPYQGQRCTLDASGLALYCELYVKGYEFAADYDSLARNIQSRNTAEAFRLAAKLKRQTCLWLM